MTVISPFPSFRPSLEAFDPTDGDYYWVTTDTYGGPGGAAGDGETDDTSAIQAVINAAASASKDVYFPAGTYLVDSVGTYCLTVPSNVTIRGASESTSKLYMPSQPSSHSFIFHAYNKTGFELSYLGLYSVDDANEYQSGVYVEGCSYATLKHLDMSNFTYGFKFGNGTANSYLEVTNCVVDNTNTPICIGTTEDSHFADLDLDGSRGLANDHDHVIYFSKGNHDTLWEDITLANGGGWGIHFYNGYGEDASTSNTFKRLDITAGTYSADNGILIFCDDYNGITIEDLTFTDTKESCSYSPLRFFGSPNAVVITGIVGSGPENLTGYDCSGTPTNCSFSGTYDGPSLGSYGSVDLTGMSLV